VVAVPLEAIEPNPQQPRQRFDAEGLEELAASIRVHGVLQPVIVRQSGLGRFPLVTGERRLRAAGLAGKREIPAIVREFSDAEMGEIALVENLQREQLNAVEEAEAMQHLMAAYGLTQEEMAVRLGKSRPAVSNALRLLQAAPPVREAVVSGGLSAGHARALLGVAHLEAQAELAARVTRSGMSVRETERLVKRATGVRRARPGGARGLAGAPEVRAVEERLHEILGTRVRIRGDERAGTLEIAFFGRADLERLLELMGADVSRETSAPTLGAG
jgi:ParB family chromosome partitioning protein